MAARERKHRILRLCDHAAGHKTGHPRESNASRSICASTWAKVFVVRPDRVDRYPWLISISIVPQVPLAPRFVVTPDGEADDLNQDPCAVFAGTSSAA